MNLLPLLHEQTRLMLFVDGENLAMRYKDMIIKHNMPRMTHVEYDPDVFVWSKRLSLANHPYGKFVRRYYFTSSIGDEVRRKEAFRALKALDIEAPSVFPRTKDRGSKRVDISLAVEMLQHAHRKHFEVAVIATCDEDYVPLIQAVKREGRQVVVWSLSNGLSAALKDEADHFYDLDAFLFSENPSVFL